MQQVNKRPESCLEGSCRTKQTAVYTSCFPVKIAELSTNVFISLKMERIFLHKMSLEMLDRGSEENNHNYLLSVIDHAISSTSQTNERPDSKTC